MEKEFIPYEQALALKELGFDEPCFGSYVKLTETQNTFFMNDVVSEIDRETPLHKSLITKAPLYQQAFRWFREKYNLQHELYSSQKSIWLITIRDTSSTNEHCIYKGKIWDCDDLDENIPDTYEEAESACLDRLIEIVKNK